MKLKRILAGALAAVVSISTVALASLSTASAADAIEADWYQGSGALEGAQFKVVQNWAPGATIDELSGATEFYITFNVAADAAGLTAYMAFQDIGAKHSNWTYSADPDAACPAVDCSKAGTYTIGYKGDAITTGFNFLAVIFVDADGKEYGNDLIPTITLVGVYAEEPVAATEPEVTEPEEPEEPAGPTEVTIDSIEYNFTVTAGGNNTVTIENQNVGYTGHSGSVAVGDSGDYSIKITGMGATDGLTNLGYIAVDDGSVTLTVNTIVINDTYTLEVGKSLTAPSSTANGMANIWNDEGKASVVYTSTANGVKATLIGDNGTSIKFQIEAASAEEPTDPEDDDDDDTTDPAEPVDPADPADPSDEIEIYACLGIAKGDFTPSTFKDTAFSVVITGDGQYTLTVDVSTLPDELGGTGYIMSDIAVLVIDFLDTVVNYPDMVVTLDQIVIDGDEMEFDADKVIYGNLEKDNDCARLEIYNQYGDTSADSPIDADAFYAEETISLTFTVSGLVSDVADPADDVDDTTEPEPTTEPVDVMVTITPDSVYALPGEEVTYTVAIIPNQSIGTLQMRMDFPEGLSYVPDSFEVDENVKTALGWNVKNGGDVEWTEDTLFLNGFTAASDDIAGTTVTLGTFKVVADELGAYTPAFTEYEFTDSDFGVLTYGVIATAVEYVTEIPVVPTDPADDGDDTDSDSTTAAAGDDDTDSDTTTTTAATTAASDDDTDSDSATTTAATTAAAATTASSSGTSSDSSPNTGAQAAVGLSIFMAAGLAGVVAIKKRRK